MSSKKWNPSLWFTKPMGQSPSADGTRAVCGMWRDSSTEILYYEGALLNVFKNVKDYGVTGDGVTDDTVNMQKVLDLGGRIFVPEGTYICGPLFLESDTVLFGAGAGSKFYLRDAGNNRFFRNADRVAGNSNIELRNLYIDGNNSNQTSIGDVDTHGNAGCLDFRTVSNLVIKDCRVHNAYSAGIETTLCDNIVISDNMVDSSYDDCIAINDGSYNALVSNNIVSNAGLNDQYDAPSGIEIQDGVYNTAVIGNICLNSYASGILISAHATGAACSKITVAGNVSIDSGSYGIKVLGLVGDWCSSIIVSDNVVDNSTLGGILMKYCDDSIIDGNIVSSSTLSGIYAHFAARVNISNNVSFDNSDGIVIDNAVHMSIHNNIVSLNDHFGISVDATACTYNRVSENTCIDNGAQVAGQQIGIGVKGDYIDVINNTCADTGAATQQYGIHYYSDSSNCVSTGNRLYGNTLGQLGDAGAGNKHRLNTGYVNENWGSASVADTDTIAHGLAKKPTSVRLTPSGDGHIATVTSVSSILITVGLINHDGAAVAVAEDVYWEARI